jgi:hypothetical protein
LKEFLLLPMKGKSLERRQKRLIMRGLRIIALVSVLAELVAAAAYFFRPARRI